MSKSGVCADEEGEGLLFRRMDAPDFTAAPDFQRALAGVPERMREDAMQEAWVAHLSGKCPILAMSAYRRRERRHEKRQPVRIDDLQI
jgi:hypothetical protein